MPKVSVLCTSYNHARFLPQAVASVLAQQGPELELIIVDDASTDGSARWLKNLEDPRVKLVLHRENRQKCRSVNEAYALAAGEYIACIDSDDVWLPGKLAAQVALLESEPQTLAVFTYVKVIDENGRELAASEQDYSEIFNQPLPSRHGMLQTMFFRGNFLNTSSGLMRRSALNPGEPFYDLRLKHLHDQDQHVRLLLRGDIRVISKPFVRYRLHGANMNSTKEAEGVRRAAQEQALILERFAQIRDVELFRGIFPRLPKEESLRPEDIPAYTAILALAHNFDSCRSWGFFELSRLLRDEAGLRYMEERLGIPLLEYYKF